MAIFSKAKDQLGPEQRTLLEAGEELCNELLQLSDYQTAKNASSISLTGRQFRKLYSMLPLDVIVPLQHQLVATLPISGHPDVNHHPFSAVPVTIHRIHDKVRCRCFVFYFSIPD